MLIVFAFKPTKLHTDVYKKKYRRVDFLGNEAIPRHRCSILVNVSV